VEQLKEGLLDIAGIESRLVEAKRKGTTPAELKQLQRRLITQAIYAIPHSKGNKTINLISGKTIEEDSTPIPTDHLPKWVCAECGYVGRSHKPSIEHMNKHKKPTAGKTCEFGCGKQATHVVSAGRFCCNQYAKHCPGWKRAGHRKL
jgi:hypothetical protein